MNKRIRSTAEKTGAQKESAQGKPQREQSVKTYPSPLYDALSLQRNLGNQAVQRLFNSGLVQAKLRIGAPNDIYEQEADRVADHVMRMPESSADVQDARAGEGNSIIQRKPG